MLKDYLVFFNVKLGGSSIGSPIHHEERDELDTRRKHTNIRDDLIGEGFPEDIDAIDNQQIIKPKEILKALARLPFLNMSQLQLKTPSISSHDKSDSKDDFDKQKLPAILVDIFELILMLSD